MTRPESRPSSSTGRRWELLQRFERATELPLLVLALVFIPVLVLPLLVELPARARAVLLAIDWFIWAAFAFEFIVRLALVERRWRFIRREWVDLLIIVLPFLRPLRIVRSARALRMLRLLRVVVALVKVGQTSRRLLVRHRLHYFSPSPADRDHRSGWCWRSRRGEREHQVVRRRGLVGETTITTVAMATGYQCRRRVAESESCS